LIAVVGLGIAIQADLRKQRSEERRAADMASRTTVLADQVDAMSGLQKQAAGALISGQERERLNRSVFAVVLKDAAGHERLLGTAWPVRPNLLATNAHVAKEFETLDANESLVVRPPGGSSEEYQVTGVAVHPGFEAFQKFERSDPFYVPTFNKSG